MTYRSSSDIRGGDYGPAFEGTGRSGAWSGMTARGDRPDYGERLPSFGEAYERNRDMTNFGSYDYDRGARGGSPQGNYGLRSGEYGRGGFDQDFRGDQNRGDWGRGGGWSAGDRDFARQTDRGNWALQSDYSPEQERWGGRNAGRELERGARDYPRDYGRGFGRGYEWESSEQVRRGGYPEREWRGDMGYNAGPYRGAGRSQREFEQAEGTRYWRGPGAEGADRDYGSWGSGSSEPGFETRESWRGSGYGGYGDYDAYGAGGPRLHYGPHTGKGPRGYRRSDDRIREEVCDRLTHHGGVDAGEFDVEVRNGEVTLRGDVDDRRQKRIAEDVAESVPGVTDVRNELRVHDHAQATAGAFSSAPPQTERGDAGAAAATANGNQRTASR